MRSEFSEFYPLSENDLKVLWKNATIVLDANVLLNIYRLPKLARIEFISALESVAERLWVPYHAALEFQRNRPQVIRDRKELVDNFRDKTQQQISRIEAEFKSLEASQHGEKINEDTLLRNFLSSFDNLCKAAETVAKTSQELTGRDPIREQIDEILKGKVGVAPASQEDVSELIEGAEERYKRSIPPGFRDANKKEKEEYEAFYHKGLLYQNQHGDLILWRQLLKDSKETGRTDVIFVTDDRKEDWWWKVKEKTLGPHPSLVEEIRRLSQVQRFWMYTSANFLTNIKDRRVADVSSNTISEVEGAARRARREAERWLLPELSDEEIPHSDDLTFLRERKFHISSLVESAILEWVLRKFGRVRHNRSAFPDFVVEETGQGIEVVASTLLTSRRVREVIEKMHMAADWLERSGGAGFMIVFAAYSNPEKSIMANLYASTILEALQKIPLELDISVVLGSVDRGHTFRPEVIINMDGISETMS
ncbi:PIN-like domain-containing protein [Paracoccus xiamenensis]|uniref:PIN-like domain-containing protein n=1 Tax=Paracoccus xiamenensis TaxID=2714901 RepID=UPI0014088CBA|nr:PIN-like domain-containing protein [Paracoccus xiamenensis]NHF74383.1 DUF4935 domain-containing protein [Paracoccus xiamenensis]